MAAPARWPDRGTLSIVQVAGHVVRSRYLYLRKHHADRYADFLDAVQPQTRELFETGPLETSWYPIELLIDGMTAADRILGDGDLALCEQMGRFSADHTLTGVFRGLLFKFGSMNFILQRAAKAWRSHYDSGHMEVIESAAGQAVVQLTLLDGQLHECLGLSIKGWVARAIELFGSEIQTLEMLMHHPEADQVTFRATWL